MDHRDDRPLADDRNRSLEEQARTKGAQVKEDIKGAARRVEGEVKNDEGLRQEHEPSMLEKVGESIKSTAVAAGEKISEISQNIGLTSGKSE
jgi:pantothenate synthetase